MNSSTEYVETQTILFKNGKKEVQGININKINQNGEPIIIKGEKWMNKKHKRFSWVNPKYRTTKKNNKALSLVLVRGMPIFNGKKYNRKSKKNKIHIRNK
jgi:hypothetical protein